MMTNIFVWVEIIVIFAAVVLLPFVLGLVFRLALKQVNARLIAVLAGALIFLLNSKVTPWRKFDDVAIEATQGMGVEIGSFMRVFCIIIWIVASFGFPCALAWIGVGIGDRITRRKRPNQASEAIGGPRPPQPQR